MCAIRRAESPGELTGKGRRNLGEQVLLQSANVPSEEHLDPRLWRYEEEVNHSQVNGSVTLWIVLVESSVI